jgi:hemoglobin
MQFSVTTWVIACRGRIRSDRSCARRAASALTWVKAGCACAADNPRMDEPDAAIAHDDPLTARDIEALVDRFYDRVQADPVLGPIFNPAVDDWADHKRRLVAFWSTITLRSGSYRGNPMAAHRPHPIRPEHFDRWLALWRDTAEEVLSPAQARIFCDHAARIARSLQYGLGLDGRRRPLDLPVVRGSEP